MRAEILAALANGVLLVALAIWILVAAVDRLETRPILSAAGSSPPASWASPSILVAGAVLHGRTSLTFAPRTARPRRPARLDRWSSSQV